MLFPTARQILAVALALTVAPRAAQAQEDPDDSEETRSTVQISLREGQTAAIYASDGTLVSERRDGAWRGNVMDEAHGRDLASRAEGTPTMEATGRPVATMMLAFAPGYLAIELPGHVGPLPVLYGRDGEAQGPAFPVTEVISAGWLTLPGDPSPEAFVNVLSEGAYCCAETLVAVTTKKHAVTP